jgi:hypothetical protein
MYNDIYNDLISNHSEDYFTQAVSDGKISTFGNTLKSTTNAIQNGYTKQMEMVKNVSNSIGQNSTTIVWIIIFILFFIIIIV